MYDAKQLDEPISLATYTSRMNAEVAKGHLENADIPAFLTGDDGGGAYPQLQMSHGVGLVVRNRDAETAYDLLDEIGALPESASDPSDESGSDALQSVGSKFYLGLTAAMFLLIIIGLLLGDVRQIGGVIGFIIILAALGGVAWWQTSR